MKKIELSAEATKFIATVKKYINKKKDVDIYVFHSLYEISTVIGKRGTSDSVFNSTLNEIADKLGVEKWEGNHFNKEIENCLVNLVFGRQVL